MLLMWSPAVAGIVTRFAFQKNLAGFGFKIGELRWWLLAVVIPVAVGLVMFGTAWVTGAAPFLPDKAVAMLRAPAGPPAGLCLSMVLATGEEIGWRGLLVPSWAGSPRSPGLPSAPQVSGSAGTCRS